MSKRDFEDQWGCYDKKNGDGGDSCAYTSSVYACEFMRGEPGSEIIEDEYSIVLNYFHPTDGIIIRHPDRDRDASDFDRGSRDQEDPWLIATGLRFPEMEKKFFWGHFWGSFWLRSNNVRMNGANKHNHGHVKNKETGELYDYSLQPRDVTGPERWAIYMRNRKSWYLFPFVWLFDIFTLGSAFNIWRKGWHFDEVRQQWRFKKNIVMNHNLRALYGLYRIWSPFMVMCFWFNSQENLSKRMDEHFNDFQDHFDFFGDEHLKTYRHIQTIPIWKRFFCIEEDWHD